jgi:pSer/pThr/pTyr-binding forkhead associated (FHA) protein
MQENGGFRLIVRRGPQPNQTFDLNKDSITLGRDITNDIVINDPEVSRQHLRLTRGTSGYNIEDLGSTNGTFIGGQRLSGIRPLQRNENISLGETVTLSYELARPEVSPPAYSQQPAATPPPVQQSQPSQPSPYAPPSQSSVPSYQQQPVTSTPAEEADYYDAPPPPDYGYEPTYENEYGYSSAGSATGYDPYAVREEGVNSSWRWVIIGCAGLFMFCCCASVIGLILIDVGNMWCKLPIFKDIITPLLGVIAELLGIIEQTQVC